MNDSSLYNSKLHTLIESFSADTKKEYASEDVLNTELMLTGQFFDYTAKIYKGTDSSLTDLGWFIPRKKLTWAPCWIPCCIQKKWMNFQMAVLRTANSKSIYKNIFNCKNNRMG